MICWRKIKISTFLFVILFDITSWSQINNLLVQTGFVYNFTKFVTWERALSPKEPFLIQVYADNGWYEVLKKELEGKKVESSEIQVVSVGKLELRSQPRIIIVDHPNAEGTKSFIKFANSTGALLISRYDGMLNKDICLNLFIEDNKVRFEINKSCIENQGFKFGSQLLKLARIN